MSEDAGGSSFVDGLAALFCLVFLYGKFRGGDKLPLPFSEGDMNADNDD